LLKVRAVAALVIHYNVGLKAIDSSRKYHPDKSVLRLLTRGDVRLRDMDFAFAQEVWADSGSVTTYIN
jgi:hypothetical protein